jgi:hypothetical protein
MRSRNARVGEDEGRPCAVAAGDVITVDGRSGRTGNGTLAGTGRMGRTRHGARGSGQILAYCCVTGRGGDRATGPGHQDEEQSNEDQQQP